MGDEKPEDPNPNPIPNPNPNPDPNQAQEPPSAVVPSEAEKETGKDMARAPTSLATNPSWFTPKRLLGIFCVINLINYIDRGAIASNGVNGSRRTCTKGGTCSSGSGIQGDFNLSNFEDGVISSAFMVGLLVASPIFASSAKSVNPFRLIGVGLTVWTLAVAFCGFSFNFWSITISRMLVGVGEASFISLAAPFIDDNAPVTQRTAWLGAFYMCIPTGVAVGYVYGGVVHGSLWLALGILCGGTLDAPFCCFRLCDETIAVERFRPCWKKALTAVDDGSEDQGGELSRRGEVVDESSKPPRSGALTLFGKDMKVLLLDKVYVVNVLGKSSATATNLQISYIAYNFVIGAYSYWGPKAGYNIYHMSNADYMFGGVTAVCGILGSLAGGFILDLMTSTISNAFKLLSLATLVGAVFCFAAFCFKSLYAFLALFAIGELLVFATQKILSSSYVERCFEFEFAATNRDLLLFYLFRPLEFCSALFWDTLPGRKKIEKRKIANDGITTLLFEVGTNLNAPVNFVCLHCVKPSLRPLSMAISTVSIHIFGDVPSSPLVGLLQVCRLDSVVDNFFRASRADRIDNWRATALILTSILFVASGIWFIGIFLHSVDRSNEDSEQSVTLVDKSNATPLLAEKTTETA
ncbi:hypothetical protein DH2020_029801 [Rehmannia glutinosa]|uniref:Major facilitator superfamily (MFS) profile domain-containing protein n=1 Tax=Rehmannia glutinosa TaxID=99300 RepID=A0ABR0VMG9_REHGL